MPPSHNTHTKPVLNHYITLEHVVIVVDNVLKLFLGKQLILLVDPFLKTASLLFIKM